MKHEAWRRDLAAYAQQGTLQPRFTDVDLWQHLNNVAQIGLHGELLQQWLHSHLGPEPWRHAAPQLLVQGNATDFLAEAHYPAPLATGVRLLAIAGGQFTLGTALFQNGQCTGLHQATLGAWQDDAPAPLPEAWHTRLQAALAAQPPLQADGPGAAPLANAPLPPHPDHWPWQISLASRFADTDGQGHTSDLTLARCAEQGRVQFLTRVFGSGRHSAPVGFMVAHVALRWHHRRRPPVAWQLGIAVQRVGERSLAVRSALFDGGLCVAESNSVMVVIDHATRRPAALPEGARAQLATYLLPAA
ncbi:MAG: thioesterase family protein [Pseudomonadota bacterium]